MMRLRNPFLWLVPVALCSVATPAVASPEFVVVLDAGHGGSNHGARSPRGALEKRVTLQVAKQLQRLLGQIRGLRVVLTRDSDEYLTLSARVRRANQARGQLFISLHCNASPGRDQQGYEVFVLTPASVRRQRQPTATARDLTVRRLLGSDTPQRIEVAALLQDLTFRAHRRGSVAFGRRLVAALVRALGAPGNRGVRQAPFDVLMNLQMPGILLEMGFLDHPVEGVRLVAPTYQNRLVGAVFQAILTHGQTQHRLRPTKPSPSVESQPRPLLPVRRRDHRRPAPGRLRRRPRRTPAVAFDLAA